MNTRTTQAPRIMTNLKELRRVGAISKSMYFPLEENNDILARPKKPQTIGVFLRRKSLLLYVAIQPPTSFFHAGFCKCAPSMSVNKVWNVCKFFIRSQEASVFCSFFCKYNVYRRTSCIQKATLKSIKICYLFLARDENCPMVCCQANKSRSSPFSTALVLVALVNPKSGGVFRVTVYNQ